MPETPDKSQQNAETIGIGSFLKTEPSKPRAKRPSTPIMGAGGMALPGARPEARVHGASTVGLPNPSEVAAQQQSILINATEETTEGPEAPALVPRQDGKEISTVLLPGPEEVLATPPPKVEPAQPAPSVRPGGMVVPRSRPGANIGGASTIGLPIMGFMPATTGPLVRPSSTASTAAALATAAEVAKPKINPPREDGEGIATVSLETVLAPGTVPPGAAPTPAHGMTATGPVIRPGGMVSLNRNRGPQIPNVGAASTVGLPGLGMQQAAVPASKPAPAPAPAQVEAPKTPPTDLAASITAPVTSQEPPKDAAKAKRITMPVPKPRGAKSDGSTVGLPGLGSTMPEPEMPATPVIKPGGMIVPGGGRGVRMGGASTVAIPQHELIAAEQKSAEQQREEARTPAVLPGGNIPVPQNQNYGLAGAETQMLAKAEIEMRRRRTQNVTITDTEAAQTIRRTAELALLKSGRGTSAKDETTITQELEEVGPEMVPVKAAECIIAGELADARNWLRRGLTEEQPEEFWGLWTELGNCYYDRGYFGDARMAYNKACEIFPDRLISQFNLGTAKLMTSDLAGALECYQEADNIESFQPKVLCNVGAVYFLQDDYESAEDILREILNIQPDYVRALNTLAAVLGAMNRLEESMEICDLVLELNPEHGEAAFKKGVIHLSLNQVDEAIPCLKIAKAHPDIQFDAFCFLAQALAAKGRVGDAETMMNAVVTRAQIDENLLASTWQAIAHGWNDKGEVDNGIKAFKKACELAPMDPNTWLELGLAYRDIKDITAEECFQTFIRLNNEVNREGTLEQCSLFQGGKEAAKIGLTVKSQVAEEVE